MYAKLPLILLNGIHQIILKVLIVARKDKAYATVKNSMNAFAIPKKDSRS
jgi:hypothetical protein